MRSAWKARELMPEETGNVSEAAMEAGDESLSQFTRDYRKMFAKAPKEDIFRLRGQRKDQASF